MSRIVDNVFGEPSKYYNCGYFAFCRAILLNISETNYYFDRWIKTTRDDGLNVITDTMQKFQPGSQNTIAFVYTIRASVEQTDKPARTDLRRKMYHAGSYLEVGIIYFDFRAVRSWLSLQQIKCHVKSQAVASFIGFLWFPGRCCGLFLRYVLRLNIG